RGILRQRGLGAPAGGPLARPPRPPDVLQAQRQRGGVVPRRGRRLDCKQPHAAPLGCERTAHMLASLFYALLALAPLPPGAPLPEPAAPPGLLAPPPPAQIMALPPELREEFLAKVRNRGRWQRGDGLQSLADFLFKPTGLGLSYRHDASH